MSRKTPWGLGLAVGLGLALTLAASLAVSQRAISNEILDSAVEPAAPAYPSVSFSAVVQAFSGPLEDSDTYLSEFMQHFSDQGLEAVLDGYKPTSIIILTEPPVGSLATGYVGLTVPSDVSSVLLPLETQQVRFRQAVTYHYQGPYEGLCPAYYDVAAAIEEGSTGSRASFPVVLELLDDPRQVDAPSTDMVIPVATSTTTG